MLLRHFVEAEIAGLEENGYVVRIDDFLGVVEDEWMVYIVSDPEYRRLRQPEARGHRWLLR